MRNLSDAEVPDAVTAEHTRAELVRAELSQAAHASDGEDADRPAPLTAAMAEQLLDNVDLITAMAGSIPEMKLLRDRCLAAGIPAVIGCPGGGKSCGPKTHLLISEPSIPSLSALLRGDWSEHLEREGLAPVSLTMADDAEHPPCPACGTAAALLDGACSDCGLQLE